MALIVVEGRSLCCGKKGILGPGSVIDPAMLGGEANTKRLIDKGVLAEGSAAAPKVDAAKPEAKPDVKPEAKPDAKPEAKAKS